MSIAHIPFSLLPPVRQGRGERTGLGRVVLILLALLIPTMALAGTTMTHRSRVDLDGTWTFCVDPDDIGEDSGWYSPTVALPTEVPAGFAPTMPGAIQVPGCWDAQGYGTPTQRVNHNFVGKGWYRREFRIPADWSDQNSSYLVLMGISRYAKVWIDGVLIGDEAIGFIGSHEWDITPFVRPGQTAVITICVDSRQRWDVDPLYGAAQLNDYLEIDWGGLWGHVYVESRAATHLSDVYLRDSITYAADGSVARTFCGVQTTLTDEHARADVRGRLTLELLDADGSVAARTSRNLRLDLSAGCAEVELWTEVPHANLWSPDTPYLYRARITFATRGHVTDVQEYRHGIREIRLEGSRVLLNGQPILLRGYGDDHIYPRQFSMPTDKEMYLHRLRLIKAYGFNHCRHHSVVMPHEYYDACDEVGIMPHAEMLLGYADQQLPGIGRWWLEGVPTGTSPERANRTIVERFRTVVREYRNHPSIFAWVGGNELGLQNRANWVRMELPYQLQAVAREEDPDRPFMDADGDWAHDYVNLGGRTTEDYYSILFDEWCNPFACPDKFLLPKTLDRPAVAHETGNFLAFPRLDQAALFREGSNIRPFWMETGIERLRAWGCLDEADSWAEASEHFYLLMHKYNVEAIRRNGDMGGYHWWLINDYWTTSNGLFDHFFRPKSIAPREVLAFNGEVALLQRGLQYAYTEDTQAQCTVQVSNYGAHPLQGALRCSLTVDGQECSSCTLGTPVVPCGTLSTPVEARLTCPRVEQPTRATVQAELITADSTYTNTWDTYLFPAHIAPATHWPIYADSAAIVCFPDEWDVHPLTELTDLYPSQAVYAVGCADDRLMDAVGQGAGLILLDGSPCFPALPLTYKTTWWKAGDTEETNILGTYVYDTDFLQPVTDHRICPPAWMNLIEGGTKYDIEHASPHPDVAIRALTSIVDMRDMAILFAYDHGEGRVWVDGLNHAADSHSSLSRWLLARMVDHLAAADPPHTPPTTAQRTWHDPLDGDSPYICGRAWNEETGPNYHRLPSRFAQTLPAHVYNLSQQGAGLSVRFSTDATDIVVRYTLRNSIYSYLNMAVLAHSGIDLYGTDDDGHMHWIGNHMQWAVGDTIAIHYADITPPTHGMRSYELFLPPYNTVTGLSIGVDGCCFRFEHAPQERPVVIYGSSIVQGASASRPGLMWTTMVQRQTGYPVINMGFSGSALMEPAVFDMLSQIDARAFILDPIPNSVSITDEVCQRAMAGVTAIRAHSDAPILMVENHGIPDSLLHRSLHDRYAAANRQYRKAYDTLTAQGVPNLYYLSSSDIGFTEDAMIEGTHPNDIGNALYAKAITNKLHELLPHEE